MSLVNRIANTLVPRPSARVTSNLASGTSLAGYAGVTAVAGSNWGSIFLDEETTAWTASATAYRCVQSIAGNAASLQLQIREPDETNVEAHWLSALWERPNELLSRRLLAEIIWARLETRGEQFVYVNRGPDGTGNAAELWPIWGKVTPIVQARAEDPTHGVTQSLLGYQVDVDGGRRIGLLPGEVLWLRYPRPGSAWGSLAPLEAAGHGITLDAYARAWQEGEFKNGAKPKHVVYLGDLSQAAHDRAMEQWRSDVEGSANAGKSLLVSGPTRAAVERLTLNPEEMSWLDTRHVTSDEVMLAFGVPKDYLVGGTTYENRTAAKRTLWSDTIVSKLEIVASEMTRQLLVAEPKRRCRFDTDDVDALQEGADAKAKRTTDLTAHDVLTLDEARAEVGLDALPNGLGLMTLTAYRTLIAAEAQAALLQQIGTGDRSRLHLAPIHPGRAGANIGALPLVLPSGERMHGPDPKTILSEYARHETLCRRAVARLAARQSSVVLTNAERLLGGKSKKAQAWLHDVAGLSLTYATDPTSDLEVQLRAKVDELFDPKHWAAETRDAMEGPVGGAWQSGALGLSASLGLDFEKFDVLVLTAMDSRLDVLADQVTATTRTVLEDRVLLQGVANGESIDQLKTRIRGVFTDLSSWRAETIARTEVVGGFNKASNVIAEASGVVTEREWMDTDDSRTRDSHRDISGQRVKGTGTRYSNGCLHPGDPTAKAEETINCRCVELYVTED